MATFGEKLVGLDVTSTNETDKKIKVLYAQIVDELNVIGAASQSTEQKAIITDAIRWARVAKLLATDAITWKD